MGTFANYVFGNFWLETIHKFMVLRFNFVYILQYKRTPLFGAIGRGKTEVIDILLTNGARTESVDHVRSYH